MSATLAVAICCGIATYRIAIKEARKEIEAAFQKHVDQMHAAHQELVDDLRK